MLTLERVSPYRQYTGTFIHGQMYTIKKILPQPERMNSDEKKEKRAAYTRKVTEAVGNGKTVLFMDETNASLFQVP